MLEDKLKSIHTVTCASKVLHLKSAVAYRFCMTKIADFSCLQSCCYTQPSALVFRELKMSNHYVEVMIKGPLGFAITRVLLNSYS